MKYPLVKNMTGLMISALLLLSFNGIYGQIPAKPSPARLVNDFASVFTGSQVSELESILSDFANKTSNQIVVVTVNDLGGADPSQFAYEIG